jgi:hypothetical protein
MRKAALALAVSALAALAFAAPVHASMAVDPADIVEAAMEIDGETVTLSGEAIGDVLHADATHVWVNVLGDTGVGIGVWLPGTDAEVITVLGDYDHRGDRVVVTGIVNAACDRHGGDLDVHSESIDVVEAGVASTRDAHPVRGIAGAVLLAVSAGMYVLYRRRKLRVGQSG